MGSRERQRLWSDTRIWPATGPRLFLAEFPLHRLPLKHNGGTARTVSTHLHKTVKLCVQPEEGTQPNGRAGNAVGGAEPASVTTATSVWDEP